MTAAGTTLECELRSLSEGRSRTLAMVEGLSQDQIDWRPDPRRWSIGEVLDHLLLAERFLQHDFDGLMERARTGGPTHVIHSFRDLDIGFPGVPRSLMPLLDWPLTVTSSLLPSALRDLATRSRLIPLRHPTVANRRRGRSVEDLRLDLRESCERIVELILKLPAYSVGSMTVSHPVLGKRDIPGILRFATLHELRHQGQIADLKAAVAAAAEAPR
jgi:hypothetical protein